MTKKAKAKTAKALSTKLADLVAGAATIGFSVAGGFASAVSLFTAVKGSTRALSEASAEYVRGYVAASLLTDPAYAKRWHNLDDAGLFDAAGDIIAKTPPNASKPDSRTTAEHLAVRAGQTSLSTAKRKAGIAPKKGGGRKPRPATVPANDESPVPIDMVTATPTLATREEANDYFVNAIAALLVTCDKNIKAGDKNPILPQVSSALSDCRKALAAAIKL